MSNIVKLSVKAILFLLMAPLFVSGKGKPYKFRDGKLLRGEVWQRFVVPEKADFYVAGDGNDRWTGTLPAPNESGTDGPFATYRISASGSDFYHAEDSYAAVFLKKIKGDFVATVKIKQFGPRTHEWFRAGLFARNDLTKSFDTQPGSKGSFLLFGTPGRAGINYDEFANGCMHKANSQNLTEDVEFPIWLKMERHGNYFVGYISLDGVNWIDEKRSGDLPGLAEAVDLGLAAGAPDKKEYWMEFKDWKVKIAK